MVDINELKTKASGIKIVHLDASAKFLENSSKLLHKIFDTVFTTSQGSKVMELFKIEKPQIFLTELEVEDISAVELIKEIHILSPLAYIIVITSHDSRENLIELISLHVTKLFGKPLNATALVNTLAQIIEEIQNQKSTQPTPPVLEVLHIYNPPNISLHTHETLEDTSLNQEQQLLLQLQNLHKIKKTVQLHNFYKGLSVTNNAYITDIGAHHITLKTNNIQQKAIQYESKTLLASDTLIKPFLCSDILKIDFNNEQITFRNFISQNNSPISRKSVRIHVNDSHTVTLTIDNHLFLGSSFIEDISIDAIKVNMDALPAGIHKNLFAININISIETDNEAINLNSSAKYLREDENDSSYSVVFLLDLDAMQKSQLVKYIAKKQMELIREFKRLNYE